MSEDGERKADRTLLVEVKGKTGADLVSEKDYEIAELKERAETAEQTLTAIAEKEFNDQVEQLKSEHPDKIDVIEKIEEPDQLEFVKGILGEPQQQEKKKPSSGSVPLVDRNQKPQLITDPLSAIIDFRQGVEEGKISQASVDLKKKATEQVWQEIGEKARQGNLNMVLETPLYGLPESHTHKQFTERVRQLKVKEIKE